MFNGRAAIGMPSYDAGNVYISGLPVGQTLCLTYYLHMYGDGVGELKVVKMPGRGVVTHLSACKYII